MQRGLDQVLKEIDIFLHNRKKKDPFVSIKTIAQRGWIGGLSYSSINKLVDSGTLPAISVDLKGARGPLRKVHNADIKRYIIEAYGGES